jgi:hypothetical protein
MDPAGEQGVVREIEPGNDVSRTKRHLLGFGEEVVGVAIQNHAADGRDGYELLGHDLGGVEYVEGEGVGLILREHLHAELPLGKRAGLDRFPKVAAVEVGIGTGDLHGFVPDERVGSCNRIPMELHKARLAVRVHEAKRVDTEALHHSIAARDGAV